MMGIRTVPRDFSRFKEISLSMLNTKLHQDGTFVYDKGSDLALKVQILQASKAVDDSESELDTLEDSV